jgi:hypothetical protein
MEVTAANAIRKTGQANGASSTSAPELMGTEVSYTKGQKNGKAEATNTHATASLPGNAVNGSSVVPMAFMYLHQGRVLESTMTVEDAGIEDADEIHAVEMMDLTGPVPDDAVRTSAPFYDIRAF